MIKLYRRETLIKFLLLSQYSTRNLKLVTLLKGSVKVVLDDQYSLSVLSDGEQAKLLPRED